MLFLDTTQPKFEFVFVFFTFFKAQPHPPFYGPHQAGRQHGLHGPWGAAAGPQEPRSSLDFFGLVDDEDDDDYF